MTSKEAVKIITSLAKSDAEAARLLGLNANTISRWRKSDGGEINGSTEQLLRLLSKRPELVHVLAP
jgi:transposase-like protein